MGNWWAIDALVGEFGKRISNIWGEPMDTNQAIPVESATEEKPQAVSWAKIFQLASDAYLFQMAGKDKLSFGGGQILVEQVDSFIVIPLGGQVLDGIAKWALRLPTIRPPKEAPPTNEPEAENVEV